MEYDDKLPFYYNNNQQFLQQKLDPKIIRDTKIFEKTQIKWFSFDDIQKQHNEFRSFYQNIVVKIIQHKSGIESFVRKSFNKRNYKNTRKLKTRKLKTRKLKTRKLKT